MKIPLLFTALLMTGITAFAQVPDSQPAPAPAPAQQQPAPSNQSNQPSAAESGSQSKFLGKDMPFMDPSNGVVSWDGHSWNITDNRVFKARFEKFLNAPAATSESDQQYQAILDKILFVLGPGKGNTKSVDEAFQLLAQASSFEQDAKLCDAIANQVYAAWQARQNRERLVNADRSMEDERKRLEWNSKMAMDSATISAPTSRQAKALEEWQKNQQLKRDMEMQPMITRMAEITAQIKSNQLKREVQELQVKVEFQALLIHLFLQRRFQHVLIGTRFYRNVFNDGDSQLRVGEDTKNLFSKTTGMPPTIGTLDSIASGIIHDVHEGIDAFNFLLENGELESASNRLGETFLIGEYLPEVRTLSRDKKRQALVFVQKANQLISALEVKDYTLAESLVKELQKIAKDFDASKAMAAIETAKTISAMHIAKARNAAVSGDKQTLEIELKAATEIWPRNPALAEVSGMIFSQADVQSRALVDFDQLISQKNYRQIYDDRMRFIAAAAMSPEKQEKLREVLEMMQTIEASIIRAQEIEKTGNYAGAWESAEAAYRQFPDDNKLNQERADLTTKAADFVRALKRAEDLEQKQQPGSSLTWYLKAQKEYPPSDFARQGIQRITKQILPDAT